MWLREAPISELLLVGLLILLILVSVVGNCLVCVAIFTDRRLRKLGNAFIVSLAIADLFVSCLVMTFALCNDLMNYWIFGEWFCDVWISFDIMCCTASILNLCAISLDRFIHIKDCLLYNQWMTRKVAISAVIIIWFISALVSFVPINLGWHKPDHRFGGSSAAAAAAAAAATANKTAPKLGPKLDYSLEMNESSLGDSASNRFDAAGGRQKFTRRRRANPLALAGSSQKSATFGWIGAGSPMNRSSGSIAGSAHLDKVVAAPPNNPRDGSQVEPSKFHNNNHNLAHVLLRTQHLGPGGLQVAPPLANHSQPLPLCQLTLTPTYAIISSTISFYIPCIIMLGLYTKLFACARKHVRNIQAVSKAPAPITLNRRPINQQAARPTSSDCSTSEPADGSLRALGPQRQPARAWLKFSLRDPKRPPATAQSQDNPAAPQATPSSHKQASPMAKLERGRTRANCDSNKLNESNKPDQQQQQQERDPFLQTDSNLSRQATFTRSDCAAKINFSHLNNQYFQQQQQQSGQLATHKAAITLGIIMGTFLFCWVPFFCLNIIKAFCTDCIPSSLFRAFTWLGYANSALNPIIYGIHNSEFRCAFNRIFFKHLNIKNSRYYLNRRSSYDFRHRTANNRTSKRRSHNSQVDSKQSYKSDTLS